MPCPCPLCGQNQGAELRSCSLEFRPKLPPPPRPRCFRRSRELPSFQPVPVIPISESAVGFTRGASSSSAARARTHARSGGSRSGCERADAAVRRSRSSGRSGRALSACPPHRAASAPHAGHSAPQGGRTCCRGPPRAAAARSCERALCAVTGDGVGLRSGDGGVKVRRLLLAHARTHTRGAGVPVRAPRTRSRSHKRSAARGRRTEDGHVLSAVPHAGQSHFLHFSPTLSVAVRAAVRAAHAAWSSGGSARGSVPGLSALSPAADLRGAVRGCMPPAARSCGVAFRVRGESRIIWTRFILQTVALVYEAQRKRRFSSR